MGDMADFYIEQGLSRGWTPAGNGRRSRSPGVYGPPLKCKHCGATDVYWQRIQGHYVLTDKTTLARHVCPPAVNTAEGFEECKT